MPGNSIGKWLLNACQKRNGQEIAPPEESEELENIRDDYLPRWERNIRNDEPRQGLELGPRK